MNSALIGYTGLVGSNIARQADFNEFYNSKNIDLIQGRTFDLVVCAGVPAVKWWANQNPEQDLKIIQDLAEKLKTVRTKHFVLISTVDVYLEPIGVDEHTAIDAASIAPYGKHRLMLEQDLRSTFEDLHVIRLPGLFGQGLKKNILFDMLCGNILEKINPASSFQWYPLSRIWPDIQIVIEQNLPLVNFSVEPILSQQIKQRFFPLLEVGSNPFPQTEYDMRSIFSSKFGGDESGYFMNAQSVLDEMHRWLQDPEVKCG